MNMKRFAIVSNPDKDTDGKAAIRVRSILEEHGAIVTSASDTSCVGPETECVITIGGDGTLIRAARALIGLEVPLIGINLGHLGYLTEIDRDSIDHGILQLISGKIWLEERMMLKGRILRNGKNIWEDVALNDIVFGRLSALNVMHFRVSVDGKVLNEYHADGMILSTPTGSTAYNLSAGGPIVAPEASLLLMTPICPHTLINRSIVLPDTATVSLEMLDRRNGQQAAVAGFDGGRNIPLKEGDCLEISRSKKVTRIVKLGHISFLELLREKMKEN